MAAAVLGSGALRGARQATPVSAARPGTPPGERVRRKDRHASTTLRLWSCLCRLLNAGAVLVAFALVANTSAGTAGAAAGPSYYVCVRVEPFIPTDLGNRVVTPATVYVAAPGAAWVDVYVQPVDAPFGGRRIGTPALIGSTTTAEGTLVAVPWAADEPYPYVEVFAVAYGQPDVNYSRTSEPITILLDWRLRPGQS